MTLFRPCIDIHQGQVKQIVGGTLESSSQTLQTNFVSDHSPAWFAGKYAADGLKGGHIIKLGPGNDSAAGTALTAYPGGMQLGGGVNAENAAYWLEQGASHVIATSFLFNDAGIFQQQNLDQLIAAAGKENLVIDLSCRRTGDGWTVAMNKWQTLTDMPLTPGTLDQLANCCDEFLIHAADVEGKCEGIDEDLVVMLGQWAKIPLTYAGGAGNINDLKLVQRLSNGKVDLTIGSALDIFGGRGARYRDCVKFNQQAAN